MADKNKNSKISGFVDVNVESPEIFGRSKSREELAEEKKEAKRIAKEKAAQAHAAARVARAAEFKKHRSDIIVLSVLAGVVLLILIGAFVVRLIQGAEAEKFDQVEGRSYFIQSAASPDMEEDRLTAVVNEVYYTRGGYLCIRMKLGNGSDVDKGVDALTVSISNKDKELIASGYSDAISDDYVVKAGDYNEYTFYVSPEYVEIKDDPLTTIYYSVTIE